MIAPTNLILTEIAGGVRLNWTSNSDAHTTEIYISIDNGDYSLLTTLQGAPVTYDDINDYYGHSVKYRIRTKGAVTVSSYSNEVNDILQINFTSYGDGSGVGEMNLVVSETTTASIDGTGRFYTDAAGTTGESTTKVFVANTPTKTYIKVPSGQSVMRIKNVITHFGKLVDGGYATGRGWETQDDTNAPKLVTDMSKMTHCISIIIFGHNAVYGDITALSDMEVMEIACRSTIHTSATYGATVTGDVTGWEKLTHFDTWDLTHFTGLCESPVMTMIWVGALSEVEFNISVMPSLKTLIALGTNSINIVGDISLCPLLAFVQVMRSNTITGSISGLTDLEYILVYGLGNTISVPNLTNVRKLGYLEIEGLVLSSANINQILADLWANRDVARTYTYRIVRLNNPGSGSPTGQGLIDLANLRAYRSPNNDPQYALWDIAVIT